MPKKITEIDIKKHENVLQADELSRAIYSCSMTARKIIAFASVRIHEKTIDETPFWYSGRMETYVPCAEFKISELLKALGLSVNGGNYEIIKKATSELRHSSVEIKESDDEFRIWNWFQFIQYSKKKDKIELHFSDEIGWALYHLKDGYSALNLRTIGEFKSFYAFRFYEIAVSWRGMKGRNGNPKGSWFFQMTPQEIRRTFKIADEAYKGRMNNFVAYVLSKPLEELNKVNTDFKVEVSKVMRGRNLVAFRFDCTETPKEAQKLKISKTDDKKVRDEKREINREQEDLAWYKMNYAEEWQEIFEDEMSQPTLFSGLKRQTAEANTYLKLKEKYQFERNKNDTRRNFEKEK